MNRLTELRPQIQQVWRLSLPAILTQITTIVMQYIDSAMVGALGANASAAIGLVASSTWLMNGVTYAVSAGFSVQVAHHIGAQKDEQARNVVRHGLISALILSGFLCLFGALISEALPVWLGGEAAIQKDAAAYFLVFALALPFSQLSNLCSSCLQCCGDMITPSILNSAMCLLDVVFNAIFIPRYGVLGAGIGTGLACVVISLIMVWRCCVTNKKLSLFRKERGVFQWEILQKAFQIGAPVAVQEIAMSGAMVVVYGFLAGVVITLIPMIVGYLFARYACKLPLLNILGSITGGMTSTPALGTLIGVAGTDDVAGSYASTYPVALVLVVFAAQLINTLLA